MWYIYTMEHYSAIKKNESVDFRKTELNIIMLRKINEIQEIKNPIHLWNLELRKYEKRH
jgi:hypothetical protein